MAGTARLVGTERKWIAEDVARLLDDRALHDEMARAVNPFGDGRARGSWRRSWVSGWTPFGARQWG